MTEKKEETPEKKEETPEKESAANTGEFELALDDFALDLPSSDEFAGERKFDESLLAESVTEILTDDELAERMRDPLFRELAEPKLPEIPPADRAKLLLQSPNRIHFYWSIKNNPYRTLTRAFGDAGSYRLAAKLVNLSRETEELFAVEAEGDWWFNVEADQSYRAEIGFYAPNRPFIRIIFSNVLNTPRKNPSPRRALASDWSVSANEFARTLDASGFRQDAFDVAIAGDDREVSTNATRKAFASLTGEPPLDAPEFSAEEMRFALLALASGYALEDLRGHISQKLFIFLSRRKEKIHTEQALAALKENFDVFADEIWEEEETGAAVFGASLVNFPKRIRKRSIPKTLLPKLADFPKVSGLSPVSSAGFPISSGSLRR